MLATSEPPACIQYTENPFPWYDDKPGKSENCLFLNIWTPSNVTPEVPKAVFFYIFGGGFFVGSTRSTFHSGEALAALGDIIVVTVNYRLGSFGFLYSGSSDAPGNVGKKQRKFEISLFQLVSKNFKHKEKKKKKTLKSMHGCKRPLKVL